MTPCRTIACVGLAWLAATLFVAPFADAAEPTAAGPIVNARPLFTEDDLLLLEVRIGETLLTESLGAYSSRAGVYLPVGELARLLDLAIVVDPPERTASGWFLAPTRTFTLDVGHRLAESGGRQFELGPADAAFFADEIYARTDVLGRLLPMTFEANRSESLLRITSAEPLPYQQKLEREQRRAGLERADALTTAEPLHVALPYRLFTAPAIDLNLALGASNEYPSQSTQWDVRLAGDLAYMGLQAYLASDDDGTPDAARLLLERRGFAGDGNGTVDGAYVGAGDVFTPMLGLGMSSRGGRGMSFSTEPRARANVFDSVDLRGEMATGFEAELYVNEVLRASQSAPIQGRYEFLDVPLVFGLNVIRIAFYGPRGERYEDVRQINVGGGQVGKGKTEVSFGTVEQNVPMFDLADATHEDPALLDPGHGDVVYSAMVTHGLTNDITVRAGAGRYTPFVDDTRNVFNAGIAAALGLIALQFDYSQDDGDGQAGALGLAGNAGPLPFVLRHTEYQGNYADELSGSAVIAGNPLRRYTDLRTDFTAQWPGSTRSMPLSVGIRRDERDDGTTTLEASGQLTASASRVLLSAGVGYRHFARPDAPVDELMTGSLDASTILGANWQVRANLNYAVLPDIEALSSSLTVDRNLSQRTALRFGVQQDWGDERYTSLSSGITWRRPFMDVTFGATYVTRLDLWTAGLQFSVGALFDPLRRQYRGVRPGATVGGALALDAFIDTNGDGIRQSTEAPLPGLRSPSGEFTAPADEHGHLLVAGLGDTGSAVVNVDVQSIEDPFLKPPAEAVQLATRPGRVTVARFPLQMSGETTVRFLLTLPQGGERGLAALAVELLDANDKVVGKGRTEYDGTVLFEGLRPGLYRARLEAEQAGRLHMSLERPVEIQIGNGGGYTGVVEARVRMAR